jgi:DnaJ-domain-containing protein 1
MKVTIYTDDVSVDKAYGELRVTVDIDVDDMLEQLDAIHKADYTAIESEYMTLVDEHYQIKVAYALLLEKFEMLDP